MLLRLLHPILSLLAFPHCAHPFPLPPQFVDPHESFEVTSREWGGPRRGGRLPEPTRFGDWERKGRCTDF